MQELEKILEEIDMLQDVTGLERSDNHNGE